MHETLANGEIRDGDGMVVGQVCLYETRKEAEEKRRENARKALEYTDGNVSVSAVYTYYGQWAFDIVWG